MADKKNKVDELVEEVSKLTVLELSDLVSKLQEKLGVSAMPMAAAPAAGATPAVGEEAPQEAKVTATVVLADSGANKIGVIKALREIKPELGLKDAKDMSEATPKEILSNVKMEEAKTAQEKLEAAGAKVELK